MPFVYFSEAEQLTDAQADWEILDNSTTTQALTNQQGGLDCPFCQGNDDELRLFDLGQPLGTGEVVIKPALGMMLPGYFLGVSREHVTSFAQLQPDQLTEVNDSLSRYERYMAKFETFGQYFRFEHGSDNVDACGSGACIDHAHCHLVPDLDVAEVIKGELPWEQLDRYEDLSEFKGHPYVYLEFLGEHFAVANPALPSQWVRRKIAEVRGLDNWDWATYHGVNELLITFMALGKFPRGRTIWSVSRDQVAYEPLTGPTLYS